jgi:hypothetical protein
METLCPNCGFYLYWEDGQELVGQPCGCCRHFVKPGEIHNPPPYIEEFIEINPEDVPTEFIAESDTQTEGVPVKIVMTGFNPDEQS